MIKSKIFFENPGQGTINSQVVKCLCAGHHAKDKTTNKRMALLFYQKEWKLG